MIASEVSEAATKDGAGGPFTLQFCSDMHLEMPMETKRLGLHLSQCMSRCDAENLPSSGGDASAAAADRCDEIEALGKLPRNGEYLALLGDIFDGKKSRDGVYQEYLLNQARGYRHVFVLAGNHEFYRAKYDESRAQLRAMCEEVTARLRGGTGGGVAVGGAAGEGEEGGVTFLDCDAFDVEGTSIRILGCTLWSDVGEQDAEAVGKSLTDYVAIKVAGGEKATVGDTNGKQQHTS
jgi:hypothetical protein